MSAQRVTSKDALRACVRWKRAVDAQPTGASNVSPISQELYAVLTAWQETLSHDAIEKEVFDDPRMGVDE